MKNIFVMIFIFLGIQCAVFSEKNDDILNWICQNKSELDKVIIKIYPAEKKYLYGSDIFINLEVMNNSKDLIAVFSQPYLFLVNGEKKKDFCVLVGRRSDKCLLSNYILFGQKRIGGAKWNRIEGYTENNFLDISVPVEMTLKPNDKIVESIKIPYDLYKEYVVKDFVEICVWKGWRKIDNKLSGNSIKRVIFNNNKYEIKEDIMKIDKTNKNSSIAVENYIYFLHGKRVKNYNDIIYRIRYLARIFSDYLAISNSIEIELN